MMSRRIKGIGKKYFLRGLVFNLLLLFLVDAGLIEFNSIIYMVIAVVATISMGLISTPSAGAAFGVSHGIASLVDLLAFYYLYAYSSIYYHFNVNWEIISIILGTLFWAALGYAPAASRIGKSIVLAIFRGLAGLFLIWMLNLPLYVLGLSGWAFFGDQFSLLVGGFMTIVVGNIYLRFFPRPTAPVGRTQKIIGKRYDKGMTKASSRMEEAARLENTGRLDEAALKYCEAANLFRKLPKPREVAECSQNGLRLAERHTILRFLQGELAESKRVLKLASEEVAQAVIESNTSSLTKRFLVFPEGQGFLDYIRNHENLQIKQLSEEHGFEDEITLGLVEVAVNEKLLHGWFADNRQAFITARKLQQELEKRLLSP